MENKKNNKTVDKNDDNDVIIKVEPTESAGLYLLTYENGEQSEQILGEDELEFIQKSINLTSNPEVDDRSNNREPKKGSRLTEENNGDSIPAPKINKQRRVGNVSWKPSSLTVVADKDPNFKYRFINTSINGRVEKMLAEGWEYVRKNDSSKISKGTMNDGSLKDGTVQRRELVLMRLPNDLHKSREQYFQSRERTTIESHNQRMGSYGGESLGYATLES